MLLTVTSFGQGKKSLPSLTSITNIEGVLQVLENNPCGVYVVMVLDGRRVRLFPENIPASFNEQNMQIVFDYVEVSRETVENCGNNKKIHLTNVCLKDQK